MNCVDPLLIRDSRLLVEMECKWCRAQKSGKNGQPKAREAPGRFEQERIDGS